MDCLRAGGQGSSRAGVTARSTPPSGVSALPGLDLTPLAGLMQLQALALHGNTGLSAAPHVHYEVHDMEGGRLNPIRFFAPSMTPQQYRALLEESEQASVSLD